MNSRIYIFEGCDRTGKSTFIECLKNEFINIGLHPFVFHLMGPTKFENITFNNDEKSLIQLAKFNDEYDIFREILNADPNNVILLDRSSFGEYIWTKYWDRHGYFTDYVTSEQFIRRHKDLFDQTLYIEYWLSDINALETRILQSPEDTKIFNLKNKSIKENIQYVYNMYEDLSKIIKAYNIKYMKIDSAQFNSIDEIPKFIQDFIQSM